MDESKIQREIVEIRGTLFIKANGRIVDRCYLPFTEKQRTTIDHTKTTHPIRGR